MTAQRDKELEDHPTDTHDDGYVVDRRVPGTGC